jgi:hypothetical protein
MSKIRLYCLVAIILAILAGCEKVIVTKTDEVVNEDPLDYIWDTSEVVQVTLNGNSISVVPKVATVNGSNVTITSAGTYNITGSLTNGQVIVNTKDDGNVRLIFDDVNIKCSSSAPVFITKAKKTIIILKDGTQNYLADGTSYVLVNGEPGAALFSNSYLAFSGEGSLSVTANYQDGISTDDGLIINSGTISVISADDGVRGKDYLLVRNGNITVKSKGDGLKSDNSEDNALGYISIDYGVFNITTTSGDAINAQTNLNITDGIFNLTTGGGAGTITTGGGNPGSGGSSGYSGTISEKALKADAGLNVAKGTFTINSADDAIHSNNSITINDGTFAIATGDDAVHADGSITINGGTINISKCYEGMEGSLITVNNGTINLVSVDDGFNATKGVATEANDGSSLIFHGGNITVNSSNGDCIDSNGNVTMTGGTVIAHGPASAPEVGIDVNGTFNVSGGVLVATGPNSGNMIEAISATSSQYCMKATIQATLSSSSLFHIQDATGKNIVTYKPVRTIYYIVVSTPDLKNGSTYSIYMGGTSTGTNVNGLYVDGTYSGGTLKKSFTISGTITNVSF